MVNFSYPVMTALMRGILLSSLLTSTHELRLQGSEAGAAREESSCAIRKIV